MRLTPKNVGPLRQQTMLFLNDKFVSNEGVFVADEEKGEIKRYLKNERGCFYLLSHNPPVVASETLHGKVEILLKPNATDQARRYFEHLRRKEH